LPQIQEILINLKTIQFNGNQKWGMSIFRPLYPPAGKSTAKALRLAMANIADIAMIKKKRRVKKHTINLKNRQKMLKTSALKRSLSLLCYLHFDEVRWLMTG